MKLLAFIPIPAAMALSGLLSGSYRLDVPCSILLGICLGLPAGLLTGYLLND